MHYENKETNKENKHRKTKKKEKENMNTLKSFMGREVKSKLHFWRMCAAFLFDEKSNLSR